MTCRYVQDYGGGRGRKIVGLTVSMPCRRDASLVLYQIDRWSGLVHVVVLCGLHATAVVRRFPSLGGRERFMPLVHA